MSFEDKIFKVGGWFESRALDILSYFDNEI